MAVDWTQLSQGILQSISKKITVYSDYVQFRAVCPEWHSSLPKFPPHLLRQFPWLMLHFSNSHCYFYDFSTDETLLLELPEAVQRDVRICSSNGWLIILDDSPTILLLDPLTRTKLHLPPLFSFPNVVSFDYSKVGKEYAIRGPSGKIYQLSLRQMRDLFIKKIIISSGPTNNDNMINALAILGKTDKLAYYKNGDQSWTFLPGVCLSWCDGIYYKEQFYVLARDGAIAVCDVNGQVTSVSLICVSPKQYNVGIQMYLVISGDDELLLVLREFCLGGKHPADSEIFWNTSSFDVYKMNWSVQRWDRVVNLGSRLLFIGKYSSVSLSGFEVRGRLTNPNFLSLNYGQCLENCIYFTGVLFCINDGGVICVLDRGMYQFWSKKIISLPSRALDQNLEI